MRWLMVWSCLVLVACQPSGHSKLEPSSTHDVIYRSDLPSLKLPLSWFDYTPQLPEHFRSSNTNYDGMPTTNITTDPGATLGRVLFYDTRLSANNTISCASCHQQDKGFSDNRTLSEGFQGGFTSRHSMGLANARFYPNGGFFWDERAATLEEQVLMPVQDPIEMGRDLATLVADMATYDEYPILFNEAFGSAEITSERIGKALAQFVRSIISYQTKFDQGVASEWENFTQDEFDGLKVFAGKGRPGQCAQCHISLLQTSVEASNNGLDFLSTTDLGVGGVTGLESDNGKFKVPSLRNIELTAPYMHDGRFKTLDEVLDFYASGIQNHINLDEKLDARPIIGAAQKRQLKAFLKTLTDEPMRTDEKFSNPFVER
jgi:cytochrome c peroxidase